MSKDKKNGNREAKKPKAAPKVAVVDTTASKGATAAEPVAKARR